MTKEQNNLIESSPWIINQKVHELDILFCKQEYEIIERIFLNVSASYGLRVKDVMNASYKDEKTYACLCICMLLIDEYLFKVFGYDEMDRNILLQDWIHVLSDYYTFS